MQQKRRSPRIEYEVRSTAELDGYYIESQIWTRELDEDTLRNGVICQAWYRNREIGKLALDEGGVILIVEVSPKHRRQGIATKMLDTLLEAGYAVQHDWRNISDSGEAWAKAVMSR